MFCLCYSKAGIELLHACWGGCFTSFLQFEALNRMNPLPLKTERLNQRRALIGGLLALCFLLTGCSTTEQQQQHPAHLSPAISVSIPPGAKVEETVRFSDYTITRYFIEEQNPILEIKQAGVTVFTLQQSSIEIGSYSFSEEARFPVGTNLTGSTLPNLVVSTHSGGAHCCTDVHVFELGKQFRHIARFDARHAEGVEFADLDRNGVLTVSMADWHYVNVIAPMIASPAPTIIFRFKDGRYQLASDLMKQPAPAKEELKKFAQEIRQLFEQAQREPGKADEILTRWNPDYPVPQLWSKMLDLIYGGNETEALKLFDEAWLETYPGKEKALRKFNALVDSSPFNPRLRFNPLSKPKP